MNRLLAAGRDTCAGRRTWPAAFGAGLTAVLAVPVPASSQTVSDVQRELNQMKQQYEAELRRMRQDYDARLRRLETRLKAAESHPPATAKASASDKGGTGCGGRHGSPTSSGTQHRGCRAGDAPGCSRPRRRRRAVRSSSRSARRRANPGPSVRSCRPPPRRPAHSIRRSASCWKARPDISPRIPNNYFVQGFRAGRRYQSGHAGIDRCPKAR